MKTFFYVYILQCADDTYYTGVTSNLDERISQHQNGAYRDSYTFNRRPVKLLFYTEFTDYNTAFQFEKQIKKWSKAKKIALIKGEFESLPNLARKRFNK